MKFNEVIHKKIGKVPVLYIAGGALAIGAYFIWRHKSTVTPTVDTSTDTATGATDDTGDAAFSALGGFTSQGLVGAGSAVDTTPTPVTADTNQAWSQRAITWIVGQNLASPIAAQAAVTAYLNGADLSYDQGRIVNAVLASPVGNPPEPLDSVGAIGQQPAQRQFSHFPGTHTVKGVSDNTYTELSALYYSSRSGGIALMQEANLGIGASGPFPVGTKIVIPAWVDPQYWTTTASSTSLATAASKNGLSQAQLTALNINMVFPVRAGTRIRVR